MADEWDQFPDAVPAKPVPVQGQQASEWDQFPDAQQANSAPQEPQWKQWLHAIKNVGEAGAQAATGITGSIAGDVAGLGALAGAAVGDVFTGEVGGSGIDPAAVRERVSNYLTYQPSDPNNLTSKVLQAPGRLMSGAGDYMASWTDNPYAQDVLRAVPQATAAYLGVRAGGPLKSKQGVPIPREGVPAKVPEATPEQIAIKKATDAGYKLTPTQAGNKIGGAVEGLSGQAALERSLSKQNVTITDNLAKKALGIADDRPLNSATLGFERAKANKAYDAMAKTGPRKTSDQYRAEIQAIDDRTGGGSFAEDVPQEVVRLKQYYASRPGFNAKDAVAKVRQLRKDGRLNSKNQDPEKQALGHTQLKIAEAIDNELTRHAQDIGQSKLASDYKAARVQLAKLGTVEDALSGTNVSAKKIWQQWKRGAPLTGELRAIAETYDSFSHVLQEASKIRQKHPFSVVDGFVAAGGYAVNPLLTAAVVARPLARAALGSEAYQRRFVAPRGQAAPASKPVTPKPAASSAAVLRDDQKRRAR